MISHSETPIVADTKLIGGPCGGKTVTVSSDLERIRVAVDSPSAGRRPGELRAIVYDRHAVMVPAANGPLYQWVWCWSGLTEAERASAVQEWLAKRA